MRKFVLTMVFIQLLCLVYAQQRPHYSQYIINPFIINPAIAGIENYTDLKIANRTQWTGINGAPNTTYLTVHGPIGKADYRTNPLSFEMKGTNLRGRDYWENYEAAKPHHGLGLTIRNDRTGYINWFQAGVSYAYHLGISPNTSISAGFYGGVNNVFLQQDKITLAQSNDLAINVNTSTLNKLKPDVSAGLWLYSNKWFGGIAMANVIPQNIRFTTDNNYGGKLVNHYFATIGYRAQVTDDVAAIPSVMVKYIRPLSPQVDVNVKMQYQDRLWAGLGYRTQEGFNGVVGVNVSSKFNVSYSYDYTTSRLRSFTNGSHEIVLGFLINNSYGDNCPRNLW
jgi:type IX secretion system PorP/SprF family membrane protein